MKQICWKIPFWFLLMSLAIWSPFNLIHSRLVPTAFAAVPQQPILYPINPALAPPAALPQGSCVSQAPAGTHGITICWAASISSTVTGYNVYVSTTAGGPYTKQNSALVSGTSYFYATPNIGGVKQFMVIRSFDNTAESANSNEVSAVPLGNPLPPTAVQAVVASLRWKTSDNL